MPRQLTPAEEEMLRELYEAKAAHKHKTAYCTVARPLVLHKWNGSHPPEQNMTDVVVQPGATLKIVMVSRLGDVGLTDDLDAENGYHLRVNPEDGEIGDIRWDRTPTWPEPDGKIDEDLDAIIGSEGGA